LHARNAYYENLTGISKWGVNLSFAVTEGKRCFEC
jgi:hypothetical protein